MGPKSPSKSPSKASQPDANLSFLYLCLQKSDYSSIDFKAVAETLNLNVNAARMRFYRLKKHIENIAFGGAGEPNAAAADETASAPATPVKPAEAKPAAKSSKASKKGDGEQRPAKRKKVVKQETDYDDEPVAKAAEQE